MKTQVLHREAMELADEAFILKFKGQNEEAKSIFLKAFLIEKEAAFQSIHEKIGEPTTSVLFKSAASLALNCNELLEAEKLICHGLINNPPFEIAEELRNLLENVHFSRHLSLQGQTLDSSEIQLVVAGKSVGYGVAKSDVIFNRIDALEQITYRTVERRQDKPFRGKGAVPKVLKLNFQPYMSVPRAASMAFTIRLGQNYQTQLESFSNSKMIIDDIIENIELVNQANFEELKEKIKDENYFKNFLSLSKELAPDGNDINLVGLTVVRDGKQKDVEFTRTRQEISYYNFNEENNSLEEKIKNKSMQLQGVLYAADGDKNNFRLNSDGKKYVIIVPEGLNDIVKKYWKEEVVIKGIEEKQNVIKLIDIDPLT